ncbi:MULTISPECIES: geranylgeranyl reductase family protein [unclassified Halorhabdus]|uniref:geranylgeranyl reductase family protein n=1 Tax=unclassified Halorhabdus TaxID=2621901 RepID=UPI0023DC2ED9|nr:MULTISPECIES: geranylgeranyl reductase family protein [unclassified Halorhabdus]WEL17798.1 Geranylgeranyl reductase family protein [Halorhabdus sp. SVX81]WEL21674.1 Geranylgeranyl reductase family protein [Halorhabdus sp. BNX81]
MSADAYDIVIVGGGTAGAFAAASGAQQDLDVVLLERKSEQEAGHIACGDAIKGKSTFPDVIDLDYLREEAFTNENIQKAVFEVPDGGTIEYPFATGSGSIVDRKRYGEVLLEEADRVGADLHFDTVVQDVVQTDDGRVEGVQATRKGDRKRYDAEVVIDAAGALSLLQDKADLADATFDTNVTHRQFCSAYREVIEVEEPVDFEDAIVFKPTEELGYLWYFPRTPTEINVGLGFQMDQEPMELVEVLREDIEDREEFQNATVTDKLGAALPTRRPYDSATAPGFIAIGDAAAHVNPTTGGGIPGAAKAGHWAAEVAADAIAEGDVSEAALWEYNHRVLTDFGKRFAAMDLYNIFGTTLSVEDISDVISALPAQQLIDILGRSGTSSMGWGLKIKTMVQTFGHWGTLYDAYKVNQRASQLKAIYDEYPTSPSGFEDWREKRDAFMDDFFAEFGADPKY